jgi:hypothetical protein
MWEKWREALVTVPPSKGMTRAGQHHMPINAGMEMSKVNNDIQALCLSLLLKLSATALFSTPA